MEMLLILILALVAAYGLGGGRAAAPQIIYVQPELAEARGIGCLPLIIGGVLLLLALGVVRF
jgi:hypothetical protein